jgi:3-hydroxyisobutyrate dehydrogenase
VAVVGAGAMGRPMAMRLHAAGISVLVCDVDRASLEPLAEAGVAVTTDAADCATCTVVLVLVTTGDQARDVVTSILGGAVQERPRLVALMSTTSPTVVTELSELLSESGIRLVDAPISGGAVRAQEGRLTVMAGGRTTDLDELRPVLAPLATEVFHCGPVGSGARMKIINNIVGTSSALVLAEASRLAVQQGLDLDAVASVLDASTGRVFLTGQPGEIAEFYGHVARDPESFFSLAAIMRKDFALATDLASTGEASMPLLQRLRDFADQIGDETYANWHSVGQSRSHPPTEGTAR